MKKDNISFDIENAKILMENLKLNILKDEPNVIKESKKKHAIFYGCYDWHSSVHSFWSMVKLIRLFPSTSKEYLQFLKELFTIENIKKELQSIKEYDSNWELPYGFCWFLKLMGELERWSLESEEAKKIKENLSILESYILEKVNHFSFFFFFF